MNFGRWLIVAGGQVQGVGCRVVRCEVSGVGLLRHEASSLRRVARCQVLVVRCRSASPEARCQVPACFAARRVRFAARHVGKPRTVNPNAEPAYRQAVNDER